MKTHTNISEFNAQNKTILTIGTFDGVHKGHRKIIQNLVNQAKASDLESTILTFFPHPRMILQQDHGIRLLNTIEEKKQIMASLGVDHLIIHPFTKEFSRLTALEFVRDILVDQLHIQKIIIGYDHRFGRNRTADIKDLKEFGLLYDFEVEEITVETLDDVSISSTKVRNALLEGQITKANEFLGKNYTLSGVVSRGKALGRTIGYPTANITLEEDYKLIPKNGVYIIKTIIEQQIYYGMMNIGTNPTVDGQHQTIEVHLLDFDQDLYDQKLEVNLLARIRDEQKFETISALQQQIKKDQVFTQKYIANVKNPSTSI